MVALQTLKNHAAFAFDPRRLKLTLLPTEQCNFRCRYCYEDFKIGKMTPRVVNAVTSLLQSRVSTLNRLEIGWFGGEPLVAPEIVRDIQSHAFELCNQNDVSLHTSMTTNGYLLNADLFRNLHAIGIRHYQISLDGKAEEHNKNRILASGAGTFERIWSNLLAAAATDLPFSIMLRIHITAQNQETIEAFVDDCATAFGSDPRFSFFFKRIANLGGSGEVRSVIPNKETGAALYNRLRAKYSAKPESYDDFSVCYAAQPNAFVIRADGRLAKCTVAFGAKSNHVGDLDEHGEMSTDIERLNRWFQGFTTLDVSALTCPLGTLRLY
jgi:uncharacterized protein